jgi:hypothetical protein
VAKAGRRAASDSQKRSHLFHLCGSLIAVSALRFCGSEAGNRSTGQGGERRLSLSEGVVDCESAPEGGLQRLDSNQGPGG